MTLPLIQNFSYVYYVVIRVHMSVYVYVCCYICYVVHSSTVAIGPEAFKHTINKQTEEDQ